MLANTPIWSTSPSTDLGMAFEHHVVTFRANKEYALGYPETQWLDAIRQRAISRQDADLLELTSNLLSLLQAPTQAVAFKQSFLSLYDQARRETYPICAQLIAEHHLHSGISSDYTLLCFDLGQVRLIEDDAQSDACMRTFANDMLAKLKSSSRPRHEIYRQVFDVYSEALICRLLRERCGANLRITKIPETKLAGPDFACNLRVDDNGAEANLAFFIEVKTLDIVDAPQRLPEMLDEGMDVQIELERQVKEGRRVAIAEGEVAPHKRYGSGATYDPSSVRKCIEVLSEKAAGNFKNTQFQRGPTFALANVLRLPLPGQGAGALAPVYYDDYMGGACVSGALWHVAFGQVGTPIYRSPRFEGAGTDDGVLARAGLLVDPALMLRTAGMIAFHHDQGAYRFDGFYDALWTDDEWGWSNLQVEQVLQAICGDYNDRRNGEASKYSRYRSREDDA